MSFKEIEPDYFGFNDTFTRGLERNNYGGYSFSVALDKDSRDKVKSLALEHNTKNPLYGNMVYLKLKELTGEQQNELLDKGEHDIMVDFKTIGVYTKDDTSYLVFKVTNLQKKQPPVPLSEDDFVNNSWEDEVELCC